MSNTRVITVAREFGSGGGVIAATLAQKLGWQLLDKDLVDEVARAAHVDPDLARAYDERIDTWMHRIAKTALWHGAPYGKSTVTDQDYFDADTMAALESGLIEEAGERGQCVIVGRGAQCLLQRRPDVFHVFIYAPMRLKVERVQARMQCDDPVETIRNMERQRADYVKTRFGCTWNDPHLFNLMLSASLGEEIVASTILHAAGLTER
jgi:cytidylate kinase